MDEDLTLVKASGASYHNHNLSGALAKLQKLQSLHIEFQGAHERLVKLIGPAGGLCTLAILQNLTYLRIGLAVLIQQYDNNKFLPPAGKILPKSLVTIRLYDCSRALRARGVDFYGDDGEFWAQYVGFLSEMAARSPQDFPALRHVINMSNWPWWWDHRLNRADNGWKNGNSLPDETVGVLPKLTAALAKHGIQFIGQAAPKRTLFGT